LKPGFTWSPSITAETAQDSPQDHTDRIDFVFARSENLQVETAKIVGAPGPWSDIAIELYPSDHRAVVAEISF